MPLSPLRHPRRVGAVLRCDPAISAVAWTVEAGLPTDRRRSQATNRSFPGRPIEAEQLDVCGHDLDNALLRGNDVVHGLHPTSVADAGPHRTELGDELAVAHDTDPEEFAQTDLIEPVLLPRFVVGRPQLSEQGHVPAQNNAALIRVVGMGALCERSPREVIRQKTCFGRVGVPPERVSKDKGVHRLYALGHGANLSRPSQTKDRIRTEKKSDSHGLGIHSGTLPSPSVGPVSAP